MNIKEIKSLKSKLANDINLLVEKFNKASPLSVTTVNVTYNSIVRPEYLRGMGEGFINNGITVLVKLEDI